MRSTLAGIRTLTLPWGAGPGTPRLVLGPDLPAAIASGVSIAGITDHRAAIIWYGPGAANDDFHFYLLSVSGGDTYVIRGFIDQPQLYVIDVYRWGAGTPDWIMGSPDPAELSPSIDIVAPLSIDSISAPRSYETTGYATAGTLRATAGALLEVAIAAGTWDSEPAHVFEDTRLYRVDLVTQIAASAVGAHLANVRIRKGSASIVGQVLGIARHEHTSGANVSTGDYTFLIKNESGADIFDNLSLTIQRVLPVAGATTMSLYGDGTFQTRITIRDIGDTSNEAAATAIAIV